MRLRIRCSCSAALAATAHSPEHMRAAAWGGGGRQSGGGATDRGARRPISYPSRHIAPAWGKRVRITVGTEARRGRRKQRHDARRASTVLCRTMYDRRSRADCGRHLKEEPACQRTTTDRPERARTRIAAYLRDVQHGGTTRFLGPWHAARPASLRCCREPQSRAPTPPHAMQ